MRAVQLISTKLDKIPVGTPFTPNAFVSLGSRKQHQQGSRTVSQSRNN